jgi:hypothetical protein
LTGSKHRPAAATADAATVQPTKLRRSEEGLVVPHVEEGLCRTGEAT